MSEEQEPRVEVKPPTVKMAGDPRGKQATWEVLPISDPEACSQCGAVHDPEELHNQNSLLYQYTFYSEHDRWPTWGDAMAHCSPLLKKLYSDFLLEQGVDPAGLEPSCPSGS